MIVRSFAKINWSLRITGKRDDGYHDLETVFQTVSLFDELEFRESDTLSLTCDDLSIPTASPTSTKTARTPSTTASGKTPSTNSPASRR